MERLFICGLVLLLVGASQAFYVGQTPWNQCTGDGECLWNVWEECGQSRCILSNFTDWGDCVSACGPGLENRTRTIIQNSTLCINQTLIEYQNCTNAACPNCSLFTNFTDWSNCSTICGPGTRSRTGYMEEPLGYLCANQSTIESEACTLGACTNCTEFENAPWTVCNSTNATQCIWQSFRRCGFTATYTDWTVCDENGTSTRSTYLMDEEAVAPCELRETRSCCLLGNWTDWSACSATCDNGTEVRTRPILLAGYDCINFETMETRPCSNGACCVVSAYGNFSSCSATCDTGVQTRNRSIVTEGIDCGNYSLVDTQACLAARPCALRCNLSFWGDLDLWRSYCGQGVQVTLTQSNCTCTYAFGTAASMSASCTGDASNNCTCPDFRNASNVLNVSSCPATLELQGSSSGSSSLTTYDRLGVCSQLVPNPSLPCSAPCGTLTPGKRDYLAAFEATANGCSYTVTTEYCYNTRACNITCAVGEWTSWSACSVTCGIGIQSRTRSLIDSTCDGPRPLLYETLLCTSPTIPICPPDGFTRVWDTRVFRYCRAGETAVPLNSFTVGGWWNKSVALQSCYTYPSQLVILNTTTVLLFNSTYIQGTLRHCTATEQDTLCGCSTLDCTSNGTHLNGSCTDCVATGSYVRGCDALELHHALTLHPHYCRVVCADADYLSQCVLQFKANGSVAANWTSSRSAVQIPCPISTTCNECTCDVSEAYGVSGCGAFANCSTALTQPCTTLEAIQFCGNGWALDSHAVACTRTTAGNLLVDGTCICPSWAPNATHPCAVQEAVVACDPTSTYLTPTRYCGQYATGCRLTCTGASFRARCDPGLTCSCNTDLYGAYGGLPCNGVLGNCTAEEWASGGPFVYNCTVATPTGTDEEWREVHFTYYNLTGQSNCSSAEVNATCGLGGVSCQIGCIAQSNGTAYCAPIRSTCDCVSSSAQSLDGYCYGEGTYSRFCTDAESKVCTECSSYAFPGICSNGTQCLVDCVSIADAIECVVRASTCVRNTTGRLACTDEDRQRYCGFDAVGCIVNQTYNNLEGILSKNLASIECFCDEETLIEPVNHGQDLYTAYGYGVPCPATYSSYAERCRSEQMLAFCNQTTALTNDTTVYDFLINRYFFSAATCLWNPYTQALIPGTCPGTYSLRNCTEVEFYTHCPLAGHTGGCQMACAEGYPCRLFGKCTAQRSCTVTERIHFCGVNALNCTMEDAHSLVQGPTSTLVPLSCAYACTYPFYGPDCRSNYNNGVCSLERSIAFCGPFWHTASCSDIDTATAECQCLPGFGPVVPYRPHRLYGNASLSYMQRLYKGYCMGQERNCTATEARFLGGRFIQNCSVYCDEMDCALASYTCQPFAAGLMMYGIVMPSRNMSDYYFQPCAIITNVTRLTTSNGNATLVKSVCGVGASAMQLNATLDPDNATRHILELVNGSCECLPGWYPGETYACENTYYHRDCTLAELRLVPSALYGKCPAYRCERLCYPAAGTRPEICFAHRPHPCLDHPFFTDTPCVYPNVSQTLCGTNVRECFASCRFISDLTFSQQCYDAPATCTCLNGTTFTAVEGTPFTYPPCTDGYTTVQCDSLLEARYLCGAVATNCTKRVRIQDAVVLQADVCECLPGYGFGYTSTTRSSCGVIFSGDACTQEQSQCGSATDSVTTFCSQDLSDCKGLCHCNAVGVALEGIPCRGIKVACDTHDISGCYNTTGIKASSCFKACRPDNSYCELLPDTCVPLLPRPCTSAEAIRYCGAGGFPSCLYDYQTETVLNQSCQCDPQYSRYVNGVCIPYDSVLRECTYAELNACGTINTYGCRIRRIWIDGERYNESTSTVGILATFQAIAANPRYFAGGIAVSLRECFCGSDIYNTSTIGQRYWLTPLTTTPEATARFYGLATPIIDDSLHWVDFRTQCEPYIADKFMQFGSCPTNQRREICNGVGACSVDRITPVRDCDVHVKSFTQCWTTNAFLTLNSDIIGEAIFQIYCDMFCQMGIGVIDEDGTRDLCRCSTRCIQNNLNCSTTTITGDANTQFLRLLTLSGQIFSNSLFWGGQPRNLSLTTAQANLTLQSSANVSTDAYNPFVVDNAPINSTDFLRWIRAYADAFGGRAFNGIYTYCAADLCYIRTFCQCPIGYTICAYYWTPWGGWDETCGCLVALECNDYRICALPTTQPTCSFCGRLAVDYWQCSTMQVHTQSCAQAYSARWGQVDAEFFNIDHYREACTDQKCVACIHGWSGPDCRTRTCTYSEACSVGFFGLCPERDGSSGSARSVANSGCCYAQTACELPTSWNGSLGCVHGYFDFFLNTCVCDSKWTLTLRNLQGPDPLNTSRIITYPWNTCETSVCPLDIYNRICGGEFGECQSDGTCLCVEGFGGADCSIALSTVCHTGGVNCGTHGSCVFANADATTARCQCVNTTAYAWTGATCSIPTIRATGGCLNGGIATAYPLSYDPHHITCVCSAIYGGPQCEYLLCPKANSRVCNGFGLCANTTDCRTFFDGAVRCNDDYQYQGCACEVDTYAFCREPGTESLCSNQFVNDEYGRPILDACQRYIDAAHYRIGYKCICPEHRTGDYCEDEACPIPLLLQGVLDEQCNGRRCANGTCICNTGNEQVGEHLYMGNQCQHDVTSSCGVVPVGLTALLLCGGAGECVPDDPFALDPTYHCECASYATGTKCELQNCALPCVHGTCEADANGITSSCRCPYPNVWRKTVEVPSCTVSACGALASPNAAGTRCVCNADPTYQPPECTGRACPRVNLSIPGLGLCGYTAPGDPIDSNARAYADGARETLHKKCISGECYCGYPYRSVFSVEHNTTLCESICDRTHGLGAAIQVGSDGITRPRVNGIPVDLFSTCYCQAGYTVASNCSTSKCVNGAVLTADAKCVCSLPYTGDTCSATLCGARGTVNGTGCTCTHPSSWGGTYCDIPLVECHNGTLNDSTGVCTCLPAYSGTYCTESRCNLAQTASVSLSAGGACVCLPGYTGSTCDALVCQNGGTYSSVLQRCLCTSQYSGTFCELKTCGPYGNYALGICLCRGLWRTNPTNCTAHVCGVHGLPTGSNQDACQCIPPWTDLPSLSATSRCGLACRNGGTYGTALDRCQCSTNYTGMLCETLLAPVVIAAVPALNVSIPTAPSGILTNITISGAPTPSPAPAPVIPGPRPAPAPTPAPSTASSTFANLSVLVYSLLLLGSFMGSLFP